MTNDQESPALARLSDLVRRLKPDMVEKYGDDISLWPLPTRVGIMLNTGEMVLVDPSVPNPVITRFLNTPPYF